MSRTLRVVPLDGGPRSVVRGIPLESEPPLPAVDRPVEWRLSSGTRRLERGRGGRRLARSWRSSRTAAARRGCCAGSRRSPIRSTTLGTWPMESSRHWPTARPLGSLYGPPASLVSPYAAFAPHRPRRATGDWSQRPVCRQPTTNGVWRPYCGTCGRGRFPRRSSCLWTAIGRSKSDGL